MNFTLNNLILTLVCELQANFDEEVTAFEGYLEKLYKLCPECQTGINKELSKQDDILQQKLENIYTECVPLTAEVSQIQVMSTFCVKNQKKKYV
jgi:hypothetical protein